MKIRKYLSVILLTFGVGLFHSCKNDDSNLTFLEGIDLPSNLNLQVELSQDNSGTVTFTPTGNSSSLFIIDFGDGSEKTQVQPGNSASNVYPEGIYTATLNAQNINGDLGTPIEVPVVVSFLPPENLAVIISPVAGDNFSIELSATADFAVGFEVYFGDVIDEEPSSLALNSSIFHAYSSIGTYEITVVALSGGQETSIITESVLIENPLLLPIDFESESLEYTFIDFGGGISTRIENPDPSSINSSGYVVEFLKEAGAETFAGSVIELGGLIDFTEFQSFKMDVWSPLVGSTVKLKIENAFDPNISAEIDATTTTSNSWETLYFDFSNQDLNQEYAKVVVFFDFGNVGNDDVFYYDNIAQGILPGGEISLPLTFENSNANYTIIGFEGAESALEVNPDPSGLNTTSNVVRSTKTVGAQFFAGTVIPLDIPIVFTNTESIKMKTWSPKANIPVRLKLENDNGDFIELDVNTTITNQWEELVWDFSGMDTSPEFTSVVVFFEFVVDLPGDGSTYYFDEIDFSN